jgi:hypothetical protein
MLVLRNLLTRPLTHDELDGNFTYLEIIEWEVSSYVLNQKVFRKNDDEDYYSIYVCRKTHNQLLYANAGNTFFTELNGHVYWEEIANNKEIDTVIDDIGLENNTTILYFRQISGTVIEVELNNILLSPGQFGTGISNHRTINLFYNEFTSSSGNYYYTINSNTIRYKENFFFVKGEDGSVTPNSDGHYLIKLPDAATTGFTGVRIKVFLKDFKNNNVEKKLLIYTDSQTTTNRIISTNVKTLVSGTGYFFPLEPTEMVEVMSDGVDWLVVDTIKKEYISFQPLDYITLPNNSYISGRS